MGIHLLCLMSERGALSYFSCRERHICTHVEEEEEEEEEKKGISAAWYY